MTGRVSLFVSALIAVSLAIFSCGDILPLLDIDSQTVSHPPPETPPAETPPDETPTYNCEPTHEASGKVLASWEFCGHTPTYVLPDDARSYSPRKGRVSFVISGLDNSRLDRDAFWMFLYGKDAAGAEVNAHFNAFVGWSRMTTQSFGAHKHEQFGIYGVNFNPIETYRIDCSWDSAVFVCSINSDVRQVSLGESFDSFADRTFVVGNCSYPCGFYRSIGNNVDITSLRFTILE